MSPCCSPLQGDSTAGLVSATAPAGAAGPSAQGNEFAFQHGSAEGASKVQPQPENQSSAQTPSHSHEGDAGSQQPAPATDSGASAASVAAGVTQVDDGAGADAAGGQDLGWGNATGSSELGALGMTGRSVSSRSGTRRRKVSGQACSAYTLLLHPSNLVSGIWPVAS